MADRKIIAVVGATGAQGGGLVRAILDDPNGGFAVRAITRNPDSDAARALARAGRRSRRRRRRRRGEPRPCARRRARRLLRHLLLGALLARARRSPRSANMARAAKAAGIAARDLVDARGHAQVGPARRQPDADAAWAGTRCRTSTPRASRTTSSPTRACRRRSCSRRSTGTTSSTSAWGRRRAPTASSRSRCRWATRSCPGIAAEDIGRCAYGIFRRGTGYVGKTVGIAGEHLTGSEMASALGKALGQDGALQRRHARGLPRLRLPRRRRPRQHVPVLPRLRGRLLPRARSRGARARSTRRCRPSRPGSRATRIGFRPAERAPPVQVLRLPATARPPSIVASSAPCSSRMRFSVANRCALSVIPPSAT